MGCRAYSYSRLGYLTILIFLGAEFLRGEAYSILLAEVARCIFLVILSSLLFSSFRFFSLLSSPLLSFSMAAAEPAAAAAGPAAAASAADAMRESDASDSEDEPVDASAAAGAVRKKRRRSGVAMVAKPTAAPADLPQFNLNIRDMLVKIRTTGYVAAIVSVFFIDDPDGKHCWCLLCRSAQIKSGNQVGKANGTHAPLSFACRIQRVYIHSRTCLYTSRATKSAMGPSEPLRKTSVFLPRLMLRNPLQYKFPSRSKRAWRALLHRPLGRPIVESCSRTLPLSSSPIRPCRYP